MANKNILTLNMPLQPEDLDLQLDLARYGL